MLTLFSSFSRKLINISFTDRSLLFDFARLKNGFDQEYSTEAFLKNVSSDFHCKPPGR